MTSLGRAHPVVAAVVLALHAAPCRADSECGRPDLLETYPKDGAVAVPGNATFTAHYEGTAIYDGEAVTIEQGGQTTTARASFDDAQGLLSFTPDADILPGSFRVHWPSLHGIGTSALGNGATVNVTIANEDDASSPTFEGLASVDWDVDREHDSCTGSVEDRFFFDLTPGAAEDDSGTENLAVVVFQTKGPATSSSDAATPVLTAPFPANGGSVRVERSIGDGTGDLCFAALVRDLAFHSSGGADREVCVHTTPPPFFYGCALSASGRTPLHDVAFGAALTLCFFGRRRQRRAK